MAFILPLPAQLAPDRGEPAIQDALGPGTVVSSARMGPTGKCPSVILEVDE